jgi:CheY-like chemotaxis protein
MGWSWHGLCRHAAVLTRTAPSDGVSDQVSTGATAGKRRVIVAGNERGVAGFLGPALTTQGIEVRSVRTGSELVQALEHDGPFHLVVTSVSLPDQTGLGVLARARALRICTPFVVVVGVRKPHIRVLVSTDSGDVLSTRFVDEANLVSLSADLMRKGPAAVH